MITPGTADGRGRHNFKDLSGQAFTRLTVVEMLPDRRKDAVGRSYVVWRCLCVCGKEKNLPARALLCGRVKSCGCLARDTARARGYAALGELNPCWRGGRRYDQAGYVIISGQAWPGKRRSSEKEHTVVMARHLGRALKKGESIHHKNGIRDDNRIENLQLVASNHGAGQRVEDLVVWAKEILSRYDPEALR